MNKNKQVDFEPKEVMVLTTKLGGYFDSANRKFDHTEVLNWTSIDYISMLAFQVCCTLPHSSCYSLPSLFSRALVGQGEEGLRRLSSVTSNLILMKSLPY